MKNNKYYNRAFENKPLEPYCPLTMSNGDSMTVTGDSRGNRRNEAPSGNSGNRDNHSTHGRNRNETLGSRQLDAIAEDTTAKNKIINLLSYIISVYPNASARINNVSSEGIVTIQVDNLSVEQAKSLGLNPRIGINIKTDTFASKGVFLDIPSGKTIAIRRNPEKHAPNANTIQNSRLGVLTSLVTGVIPQNYLLQEGHIGCMTRSYSRLSHGHGEHSYIYTGNKFKADKELTAVYLKGITEKKEESQRIKDAVKFTADFYTQLFTRFGKKQSELAKELAELAKGHSIKNLDEALSSFEKYKNTLYLKYNAYDFNAIVNALESIDKNQLAANLTTFGKAFDIVSWIIDGFDLAMTIAKSIETQNWRPTFVKIESMIVSKLALSAVAIIFSLIASSSITVVGFSLLIAILGALIDDQLIEEFNALVGI